VLRDFAGDSLAIGNSPHGAGVVTARAKRTAGSAFGTLGEEISLVELIADAVQTAVKPVESESCSESSNGQDCPDHP
jgi:hypothetical protein